MSNKYGPFNRKVDLFVLDTQTGVWEHAATTTWAKNLEDAVLKYSDIIKVPDEHVKAYYSAS